jgi:hypothetical protein
MGQKALGRLFDIGVGVAPVDIDTADAATGKRIWLGDCGGVTVVALLGAGDDDNDLVFTNQEHTAYTSGTSRNLAVVTEYHIKAETALDNDETWTRVSQSAAATVTVNKTTYGATQRLIAWYVGSDQLSSDCAWFSVNEAMTTNTSTLMGLLYIKHDLNSQRIPANLPNLLNPGVANA